RVLDEVGDADPAVVHARVVRHRAPRATAVVEVAHVHHRVGAREQARLPEVADRTGHPQGSKHRQECPTTLLRHAATGAGSGSSAAALAAWIAAMKRMNALSPWTIPSHGALSASIPAATWTMIDTKTIAANFVP